MFYGSEHSDLMPTNREYAFVGSLGGLYRLLLGCWRRETCAPRLQEKWSESNPTCGVRIRPGLDSSLGLL